MSTIDFNNIRCVIFDLDDTLWKGEIHDGLTNISLRYWVNNVLDFLDKRGILLSIASKNYEEDISPALSKYNITKYFLYPRINWQPKSMSVNEIMHTLNLLPESILFIDNDEFEREEVRYNIPGINTMDPIDIENLLNSEVLNKKPVTKESLSRRKMYMENESRNRFRSQFSHNEYIEYLKSCRVHVLLKTPNENETLRIWELYNRTNRLNFCKTNYNIEQVYNLVLNSSRDFEGNDIFKIIKITDKFGSYGVSGLVNMKRVSHKWFIKDLLFSCRAQGKGVEFATISYILKKAIELNINDVVSFFAKTQYNKHLIDIYPKIGFKKINCHENVIEYIHTLEEIKTDYDDVIIIRETDQADCWSPTGIPLIKDAVLEWLNKYSRDDKLILNIGSGWDDVLGEEWEENLQDKSTPKQIVNLDIKSYKRTDIVADAGNLKHHFSDNSVDIILCLDVLEHSKRPWKIAEEITRVLKSKGVVICSVPSNNIPHHPYPIDWWRFTHEGILGLFGLCGLSILHSRVMGDSYLPSRVCLIAQKS
ncbi:MAG: HAD-IIIC family phosphatase [candidate division Zixibacteria bacterium]|nr:HAD-IIIC family phosphatase [candidate division Zixibacteria bacterium]